MIDWAAKARVFSNGCQDSTPKTPITYVSGVSGVLSEVAYENASEVSGVLGVHTPLVSNIDSATLEADLLHAAIRVCDRHGDGQAARDEMRADCLALPAHLQADLLDHFRGRRVGVSEISGAGPLETDAQPLLSRQQN
ncbi:MAG: hypothetical protein EOP24_36155 [Hyphomicrobiales bacterium]|nr:MAG: hypothetical protein EOP24_36155 [Hyphomicrobiales bacterium]